MISSAAIDRLKPFLPIFIVLAFSAGLLASDGLVIKLFLHDSYVLFDGMWRVSLGDVPHIDFHTPVGQAYFWPFLLLSRLGDHGALTIIHAHVVVGVLLASAMVALLPRRLTPLEMAVSCAVILAMAMAPRDVDGRSYDYSWLAPYNRWSWGLWMLTVQAMVIPPTRARHWLDGIVLGLLAGLMAYIKLSFFAVAAVLALLAMLTGRLPRKTALVAGGTMLVLVMAVELIWHNNLAYWADLRMAMTASNEGHYNPRITKLWSRLFVSGATWVALPVIFRLASPHWPMRMWIAFWWRPMAIAAAVLFGGMLVSTQNFPDFEFAHLVLTMVIAWQLIRHRWSCNDVPHPALPMPASYVSTGALILVMGWALLGSAKDMRSIFSHAVMSRDGGACHIPALAGTPAADLMVPAYHLAGLSEEASVPSCTKAIPVDPLPHEGSYEPVFYLRKLERTMALIRAHARPGEVIYVVDFSNPYPFLFRTKSPRGAMLWMDMGRSYGYLTHPPAGPILQSSDLVIQTKTANPHNHPGHAWTTYGPYVSRYFHVVGENEIARLWRRNGR